MVFESIVIDILNRLLGDYFENLDTSQLRLGIWGGDVVLTDLLLRSSAMDDLGLPFRVVVGKLGSLRMKVPWQSLYTSSVELNLENLVLLVTPSYSVKYNEKSEEKAAQATKEKELARLDEIRNKERLKEEGEPANPQEDTFSEKLIHQIIKNVQIKIDCIHIRYEDDVTKPLSPFAFGIVLKSLRVETTDGNWQPVVLTENVETVNKLATLNGLAVYWNSNTSLIQRMEKKVDMMESLRNLVVEDNSSLTYVLGPISSTAKIHLTPNPQRCLEPFSKPKFSVDLVIVELGLGMTDIQFQDIMQLVESIDFMSRAHYYRKYRPEVTVHRGHFKEWWIFAYTCILEEDIRRKRQNWNWEHIKRHRQLCRTYVEVYYKKLTMRNLKPETVQTLQVCEKELDVFNITLVRKQVEVKVELEGKEDLEDKRSSHGWFSGWSTWFSGEAQGPKPDTMEEIVQKLGKAMTPEEKTKLYEAIDYSENAMPLDYPDTYLEYSLNFCLSKAVLTVRDTLSQKKIADSKILFLTLDTVETRVATRPVKKGLRVDVTMGSFNADGIKLHRDKPAVKLMSSKPKNERFNLLEVFFESNPLNSQANQVIRVKAQPIQVVYDGNTIVHLVRCFRLPQEMQLSKLQAAAVTTLNEWRESSVAGLQHLVQTRGEIDLKVHLLAPYLIIPRGGLLEGHSSALIVDLGELKINSVPRKRGNIKPRQSETAVAGSSSAATSQKSAPGPDIDTMKTVAYDTMVIELKDFEVFLALPGEKISSKVNVGEYDYHSRDLPLPQNLVRLEQLLFQLEQSLIPEDPRFPRLQLEGNLPVLDLDFSEDRLTELVTLLATLPFPKPDVPDVSSIQQPVLSTIHEDPSVSEAFAISRITYESGKAQTPKQAIVEFIDLILKFSLDSMRVKVFKLDKINKRRIPFVEFGLQRIQAKITNKTFSFALDVAVGGLSLYSVESRLVNSPLPFYILKTPMTDGIDKHLLKVHLFSVAADCPTEFSGKVKQIIRVEISTLDAILHKEALLEIIQFAEGMQKSLEKSAAEDEKEQGDGDTVSISSVASGGSGEAKVKGRRRSKQLQKLEATRRAMAKKVINQDDILLQIDAKLESLTIMVCSDTKNLMKVILSELDLSMVQKPDHSVILMELKDLGIKNLDPRSIYKDVIRVDSDKVVDIKIILYDNATKGQNYYNMEKHDISIKVETGSPKIFYISKQLDDLLSFIDEFAGAKEAVVDASSAAALAAKENVQQAVAAATRVFLDIELNAPIVFIPRSEKSQQGVLADLGFLTLKNKFVKHEEKKLSATAIMDRMNITLTNIKLSRIHFNRSTQDAQSEVLLLDPITFELHITRNLSSDWYHAIADFRLDGKLHEVFLRASNEDYDVVMNVLFENILYSPELKEIHEIVVPTSEVVALPSTSSGGPSSSKEDIDNLRSSSSTEIKKRKASVSDVPATQKASSTSVKTILSDNSEEESELLKLLKMEVNIKIPQLRVMMYLKGSAQLEVSQGVIQREERVAFADFAIRNVNVDMKSWRSGNIHCPITVEQITLKDIRPGVKTIGNLIQRKIDRESLEESVVKFLFKTDVEKKMGTTMSLQTCSLTIILCLDYLLLILDFFSRPDSAIEYQRADISIKYESFEPDIDEPEEQVREVTADRAKVETALDEDLEAEDPFCAFFDFSEIELILVESMETTIFNGLLLRFEVSLKQQEISGKSNMMGSIGNLTLNTCNFSMDGNHQAVAEVVSPMSLTLVMNYSDAVGTLIDVNISDIFIRMTAGTLELLLKVIHTLSASVDSGDVKEEQKDYSDLWDMKKNQDMKFWFLNPDATIEVGLEALHEQEDKVRLFHVAEDLKVSERLVLESGCIVLTFETGLGNNSIPMLLIETDVDLQMFDWSTNLTVAGRLKLEAAYYNATFGLWEYLIEPIESRHHGRIAHQPWEMLFEYSSRLHPSIIPADDDATPKSYMSITLESSNILEVSVTRTALEVMQVLKDDFNAATKKLVSEKAVTTAAYSIVNDTGSDLKIIIKEKNKTSHFTLFRNGIEYEQVILKKGTTVNLGLVESRDMTRHHTSVLREQDAKEERLLSIEIDDYNFKKEIPVHRASKRYYPMKPRDGHGHYGLICDTWVKDCSKVVTLRSVVQVRNDLQVDVDVYYRENIGTKAKLAGTARAGQKCNLPIHCTHTRTGDLFFAPVDYKLSDQCFSWLSALKEMELIDQVYCRSKTNREAKFHIKVVGEAKQALHESTNRKNIGSQCCYIYLEPPILINNLLPVSFGYFTANEFVIAAKGTCICVTNLAVELNGSCQLHMKIPEYNKMSWVCIVNLDEKTPEISQWTFNAEEDPKTICTIGIHKEVDNNEVTLHFYCPYWMINRTGLDLIYKGADKSSHQTPHPKTREGPVLFSFPGKAFFSKKACQVKVKHLKLPVAGSEWSEKFSLDIAGSGGCLTCKSPVYQFQMGVEIQLSSWGLTKYIIFTPRYYLVNQCSFMVFVKEVEKPEHVEHVSPNSCTPFWPESRIHHLTAIVAADGKKSETKAFRYDEVRDSLLQVRNRYGALHVDIHYTDSRVVITFTEFVPGQAPALLVNATKDCPLEIMEEGLPEKSVLRPQSCQLYTWKAPIGSRTLKWAPIGGTDKKSQGSDKLYSDGCGSFMACGKTTYWISFLDGLQRILLFTASLELSTYLQATKENEVATSEYIVMLHGIGISLVDNEKLRELMYMRIASSDINWESSKPAKKKRFKTYPYEMTRALEMGYQNYLNQKAIQTDVKSHVKLDAGVEVDFATMMVTKPIPRNLRRVFQTGIWFHYKTLPTSIQFHAKINRLQIDNQLADTIFRVIFAPTIPQTTVSTIEVPKPFVEVSVMQRINAHNYVQQFKYFKILVQEFHVKLDITFVNAVVEMFSGSTAARQQSRRLKYNAEYEEACLKMKEVLERQIVSQGQKHFYDFLHLSPLKIHISFSMGGTTQLSNHFLNLILASVGVTLTEIQDVIFKLSCLELQNTFLSGDQLYNEVYSHYTSQAIKQLYVLVLGLDVLGNPYGLAMGVASGVEAFFYEPIQGAIQGPGEFAEGLAIGVKKLLGSTVGGAAGAFSKITGTIGKGIAALTMDDEYQKKRRENMHKKGDAAEGLARSGKGLIMGFFDGITGVVTQPIRGAKEHGVSGFFKGIGKGTIGLVARPAAGVVDFASGSFEAVKKTVTANLEIHRMRPPRCIPPDSVLQPYIKHEAEGTQLLLDLDKGRYAKTDSYTAHALINPHGVYVLLLTNKRIMYLKRDELFGGWGVEWGHIWEDFAHPPDLVEQGIVLTLKDVPSRRCKMFGQPGTNQIPVTIYSPDVCTWLLNRIEEAMRTETGMVFSEGIEATEQSFA